MQNSSKIIIATCILVVLIALAGKGNLFSVSKIPTDTITATSTVVATSTATTTVVVATTTQPIVDYSSQLELTSPKPGSEIKSPLTVIGRLKGGWFFEANAGLALLDQNKQPITVTNIMATTDWMTADWVSFKGTVGFPVEYKGKSGYLQISNDNPSGMPENEKKILVPVLFR